MGACRSNNELLVPFCMLNITVLFSFIANKKAQILLYPFAAKLKQILKISDLNDVQKTLLDGKFISNNWFDLGMELDIIYPTLKEIERDYQQHGVRRCLTECLAKWLQANKATYKGLVDALKTMRQNEVADSIISSKLKFINFTVIAIAFTAFTTSEMT